MNKELTVENICNLQTSYQNDTWSEITMNISLITVLELIKTGKFNTQINRLRIELNKGNKEYYDSHKMKLPAVTFSGVFEKKRILNGLLQYNPVIVIDIDKLEAEAIERVYSDLFSEKIVFSFWKSPSNTGFKGIVPLHYKIDNTTEGNIAYIHKCAFHKLSVFFKEKYNIELDKSGSDITRLCFLSSDENLITKDELSLFEIFDDDVKIVKNKKEHSKKDLQFTNSQDSLYNPANKNNPMDRKFMSDIIAYLNRKKNLLHMIIMIGTKLLCLFQIHLRTISV